ncbi:hypothetical protein [uncultured Amnibacterium sp.]|uniref:hypothetical protein n=1 Tax=uncultured Amnibacterium sp. TaxID=1631851 RepID=UPI0035C9FBA3
MSESVERSVRADAAARAEQAWLLRVGGATWEEIAEQVGFAHATNAARAAQRYGDRLPRPDLEHVRQVLRARAEWLWRAAQQDVTDQRPGAVRAAAAVLQRISAFEGTDRPVQVSVGPSPEMFEAVVNSMVAHQRGAGAAVEVDVVADLEELEAVDWDTADGDPTAED